MVVVVVVVAAVTVVVVAVAVAVVVAPVVCFLGVAVGELVLLLSYLMCFMD